MSDPYFDTQGNLACAGGEALRIVQKVQQLDGTFVDLTGRTIVFRVVTPGNVIAAGPFVATIDGERAVILVPGDATKALEDRTGLKPQLYMLVNGGRTDFLSRFATATITNGGPLVVGDDEPGESQLTWLEGRGTLIVSAQGAPGDGTVALEAAAAADAARIALVAQVDTALDVVDTQVNIKLAEVDTHIAAKDVQIDAAIAAANTAATSAPTDSWKFPVIAADFISGAPSILNYIPASMQKAVIAGTSIADLAPYINQALAHSNQISFDGLAILIKSSVQIKGRKRIFGCGSVVVGALPAGQPMFTTGVDENGDQYIGDLFIQDVRINSASTIFKFRMDAYLPRGFSVKAKNVLLDGQNRTAGTRAFDFRCVDFCAIESVVIRNFDMAICIEGYQGTGVASVTNGSSTVTIVSSTERVTTGILVNGTSIPADSVLTATATPNVFTLPANYTGATNAALPITFFSSKDSTQNQFDQVGIENVNSVGYIADCDLLTMRHVDSMSVGSGFVIGKDNFRVTLDRFHVERIGYDASWNNPTDIAAGKSVVGWGLYIQDNVNNTDILVLESSFFHNTEPTAAIGGIYRGRNTNGTRSNVKVENTFIEAQGTGLFASWKIIEAHSQLDWEGEWFANGNGVVLGESSLDTSSDFVIREPAARQRAGGYGNRSILPGTKAISLRKTSGTAPTVSEDPGNLTFGGNVINFVSRGHRLQFSATGEIYELVTLPAGWYTMFVTAAYNSGVVWASIRSDDLAQNYLQLQVNAPSTYEKPLRMVRYIGITGACRIGFRSSGAADLIVGSIGLFRGLYTDTGVPRGRWDAPPILDSKWPAASAFYEGEGFTRDYNGANSTLNVVHDCVRQTDSVGATTFAWKARA